VLVLLAVGGAARAENERAANADGTLYEKKFKKKEAVTAEEAEEAEKRADAEEREEGRQEAIREFKAALTRTLANSPGVGSKLTTPKGLATTGALVGTGLGLIPIAFSLPVAVAALPAVAGLAYGRRWGVKNEKELIELRAGACRMEVDNILRMGPEFWMVDPAGYNELVMKAVRRWGVPVAELYSVYQDFVLERVLDPDPPENALEQCVCLQEVLGMSEVRLGIAHVEVAKELAAMIADTFPAPRNEKEREAKIALFKEEVMDSEHVGRLLFIADRVQRTKNQGFFVEEALRYERLKIGECFGLNEEKVRVKLLKLAMPYYKKMITRFAKGEEIDLHAERERLGVATDSLVRAHIEIHPALGGWTEGDIKLCLKAALANSEGKDLAKSFRVVQTKGKGTHLAYISKEDKEKSIREEPRHEWETRTPEQIQRQEEQKDARHWALDIWSFVTERQISNDKAPTPPWEGGETLEIELWADAKKGCRLELEKRILSITEGKLPKERFVAMQKRIQEVDTRKWALMPMDHFRSSHLEERGHEFWHNKAFVANATEANLERLCHGMQIVDDVRHPVEFRIKARIAVLDCLDDTHATSLAEIKQSLTKLDEEEAESILKDTVKDVFSKWFKELPRDEDGKYSAEGLQLIIRRMKSTAKILESCGVFVVFDAGGDTTELTRRMIDLATEKKLTGEEVDVIKWLPVSLENIYMYETAKIKPMILAAMETMDASSLSEYIERVNYPKGQLVPMAQEEYTQLVYKTMGWSKRGSNLSQEDKLKNLEEQLAVAGDPKLRLPKEDMSDEPTYRDHPRLMTEIESRELTERASVVGLRPGDISQLNDRAFHCAYAWALNDAVKSDSEEKVSEVLAMQAWLGIKDWRAKNGMNLVIQSELNPALNTIVKGFKKAEEDEKGEGDALNAEVDAAIKKMIDFSEKSFIAGGEEDFNLISAKMLNEDQAEALYKYQLYRDMPTAKRFAPVLGITEKTRIEVNKNEFIYGFFKKHLEESFEKREKGEEPISADSSRSLWEPFDVPYDFIANYISERKYEYVDKLGNILFGEGKFGPKVEELRATAEEMGVDIAKLDTPNINHDRRKGMFQEEARYLSKLHNGKTEYFLDRLAEAAEVYHITQNEANKELEFVLEETVIPPEAFLLPQATANEETLARAQRVLKEGSRPTSPVERPGLEYIADGF
jgi:hypothetical protein